MTTTTRPLTRRMLELLRVVQRLTDQAGHPPSMLEVGRVMGISAVSALRLARAAAARGGMSFVAGRPRTWRVIATK